MKLLYYINEISPNKPNKVINSVTELTDEEFRFYSMEKAQYLLKTKPKLPKAPNKQRKVRSDTGKVRNKYDSSLPKGYLSYLKRANRKGIPFELTVEQWQRTKYMRCHYCGDSASGIDRIDSSNGYTEDNMIACCRQCNIMKFTYSVEEFLNHVKKIHNYQNRV